MRIDKLFLLAMLFSASAQAVILTSDPVQEQVTHCKFYFNTTVVKPVLSPVALDDQSRKVCRYDLPTLPLGRYTVTATTALVGTSGNIIVESVRSNSVIYIERPAAPILGVTQ
jgi:hypothetical protein